MSISVKNISLSINDAVSKQFNIELDGVKYSVDNFKLTQKLLEPCRLEFKLRKSPEEDISEIQFTTCGSIVGKDVKLTLQTDSVEQEISGFAAGTQNADIEFEGFVTSAKATRSESEYGILVVAETIDTIMKDSPDFDFYNEMTLADIVNDVLKNPGVEAEVQPKLESSIFFTVQYNETKYQFLQRLARRHGEWMFNNGKKLHFGKFSEQDSITLGYPSKDLDEYSARLKPLHVNSVHMQFAYNELASRNVFNMDDINKSGSRLGDIAFDASKTKYAHKTANEISSQAVERDDEVKKGVMDKEFFHEPFMAYQHGRMANMLVYDGKSFCSKMKIGAKLTIKDNYISSGSSEEKSEVQQDEILITEVVHHFFADEQYYNKFKGITAAIDYPPYLDPTIYPVCDHPLRAVVKDTEDPKHWGRVRVVFPVVANKHGSQSDPKFWTPWIHVAQSYTGSDSNKFGVHLIPEKESQVYVDFDGGNFERPFVSGAFFTSDDHPVDGAWYPGNNKVKAIRTASGHTIEIHDTESDDDWGDKGYIRIYDHKLNYYELLLSTDSKLIKLKSAGNIELYADNNIIVKAGNNINVNAGNDIKVGAGNDMKETAGNDYSQRASNDMTMHTGNDMRISADNDMHQTTINNYSRVTKGNEKVNVSKNQTVHIEQNQNVEVTKMIQSSAENIQILAQNEIHEDSVSHQVNASNAVKIGAGASIDLKAAIIKEN